LISANVDLPAPLDLKPIRVESAAGMLEAVLDYYNNADAVVMAAAVADYSPKIKNQKLKIKNKESLSLELEPTVDILKTIAKQKGRKERVLVGFALETENLLENAQAKLKEKDLDLIVANDPSTFGSDSCELTLIDRQGKVEKLPRLTKLEAAHKIWDKVKEFF
jgi:phosphopantothenoylcysteine decarboxylase/phosphopantothenate--cysteine ligase